MNSHLALILLVSVTAAAEDSTIALGKALYERPGSCITCHQANGQGIPSVFPPLAGSEWVTGDKATLIRIADFGLEGEITVGGQAYHGYMMGQRAQNNDIELAALLTYIRKSFGNNADAVQTDAVTKQRLRDATRDNKPWTAKELQPATTKSP